MFGWNRAHIVSHRTFYCKKWRGKCLLIRSLRLLVSVIVAHKKKHNNQIELSICNNILYLCCVCACVCVLFCMHAKMSTGTNMIILRERLCVCMRTPLSRSHALARSFLLCCDFDCCFWVSSTVHTPQYCIDYALPCEKHTDSMKACFTIKCYSYRRAIPPHNNRGCGHGR